MWFYDMHLDFLLTKLQNNKLTLPGLILIEKYILKWNLIIVIILVPTHLYILYFALHVYTH